MKKFIKYILFILLVLNISSIAEANTCYQPNLEAGKALLVFSLTNQQDLVADLLNNFCFKNQEFENYKLTSPFFFSQNISMLKLYQNGKFDILNDKNKDGRDFLSELLLRKKDFPVIDQQERDIFNQAIDFYKIKNHAISNQPMNVAKFNELLEYVAKLYSTNNVQHTDLFGNNDLDYAIMTERPNIVKILLSNNQNIYLFQKNKNNLPAIYFLFAPKEPFEKSQEKENLKELNEIALKNLNPIFISQLNYGDLTFFDIAHLLKDNNIDFYNDLKKEYHFKLTPLSDNLKQEIYQKLMYNLNYQEKLKK